MHPKFKLGAVVQLLPTPSMRNIASGAYTIVRQLPEEAGEFSYRIKNARENFERTAKESQLEEALDTIDPPPQASPQGLTAKHKGIGYTIRARTGPNEWTWTFFPKDSKPRQGQTNGMRADATQAAKRAIDKWVEKHHSNDKT